MASANGKCQSVVFQNISGDNILGKKKTLYVFKQHSNVRIYPKTGSFVLRVYNIGEQGSIYSGTNDNCLSI